MGGRAGGGGGGRVAGGGGGLAASRQQAAQAGFNASIERVRKARKEYNDAVVKEGQHSGDKAAIANTAAKEKAYDSAVKRFEIAKKRYEKTLGRKLKRNPVTGKWS